jgi:DNA-binding CsgD family transcriptional regulator
MYSDFGNTLNSQIPSAFDWQDCGQPHTPAANPEEALGAERLLKGIFSGHLRFHHHFVTQSHAHAILVRGHSPEYGSQIPPAWLEVFERFLLGESQKAIAIDVRVSQSSISTILQQTTTRFGVGARRAAIPLLLILLAQAARLPCTFAKIECERMSRPVLRVSVPRPDLLFAGAFPSFFTEAELDVLRLLVAGNSPASISAARGSRPRTVANQLSTVYSKLRTSGRMSVVRQLQVRLGDHTTSALHAGALAPIAQ